MRWTPFVALIFVACSATFAQPVFDISGGYSHLSIKNHDDLQLDKDGAYIDGDAGVRLDGPLPLVLGGGVDLSGYFASQDVAVPQGGGTFFTTDYSDFGLATFEGRAAIPIMFGSDRGFFVEPRIGAGLLWEEYDIDNFSTSGGNTNFYTLHHDGLGVEVRPGIQLGYSWGPGAAGIETTYMASWGDMGAFGSQIQELHVGAFFSWRF
jgi:hypothetical protein